MVRITEAQAGLVLPRRGDRGAARRSAGRVDGAVPALPTRAAAAAATSSTPTPRCSASSRPRWSPSNCAGWPGSSVDVEVEPLPGDGFGWRTRVRWALDPAGRIGPRGVRSHRVEGVNSAEPCLIAAPELTALAGAVDVPTGIRGPVRARGEPAAPADRPAGGRAANRGRTAGAAAR